MIIAIHQPNFCPWLSFFDKMNKADVFVLMINAQYEKNGWQNRCEVWGKYWTKPVKGGLSMIHEKQYADGGSLREINQLWILAIAKTLGIDTNKIHVDFETSKKGTDRIVEICKRFDCDQYLTNPEAMDKYLDEKKMNDNGIEVLHHHFPYKKHTFEAFNDMGIEGTVNLLNKEKELWLTRI